MNLSAKFYRLMFFYGALWNFSAIPSLLFPELSFKLFFGTGMEQSLILGNYYGHGLYLFWWTTVLILGIGYYIVSRDLNKNTGIVMLGIIGKLCYSFFFIYSYFTGKATILAFLGGMGDLTFTVFFVNFLWQTRNKTIQL